MPPPEIRILTDIRELADEASDLFIRIGRQAITESGHFRVALSGGSTPKTMYSALTTEVKHLDWTLVQFFFGDDRCVPPDHPESNFAGAEAYLFRPLKIPSDQIFRIPGEKEPPETAANQYEETLRTQFGVPSPAWPRFHLILLGLGDDGHTASLFPDTPALHEHSHLVVPTLSPKGIPQRITFTVPFINQAETVVFLVAGANKATPVHEILERPNEAGTRFPAGLISPERGRLIWLLDQQAASKLPMALHQNAFHEE